MWEQLFTTPGRPLRDDCYRSVNAVRPSAVPDGSKVSVTDPDRGHRGDRCCRPCLRSEHLHRGRQAGPGHCGEWRRRRSWTSMRSRLWCSTSSISPGRQHRHDSPAPPEICADGACSQAAPVDPRVGAVLRGLVEPRVDVLCGRYGRVGTRQGSMLSGVGVPISTDLTTASRSGTLGSSVVRRLVAPGARFSEVSAEDGDGGPPPRPSPCRGYLRMPAEPETLV